MIELQVVEKNFATNRTDRWWIQPTIFGTAFILFVIYSLYMVFFDFNNGFYTVGGAHYTSPFYGPKLVNWESYSYGAIFVGYALVTLWAPFGFRGTCYYMRRVYYRSIFPLVSSQGPPACAVDGLSVFKGKYKGETRFPWFLNNFHRYFLYLAILLALHHWYEFFLTMDFGGHFGIHLGTALAFIDSLFLTLYVTSCHAFRHLLGGGVDQQGTLSNSIWKKISRLNEHHGTWFWLSMGSIFVWDLYIRILNWYSITGKVF